MGIFNEVIDITHYSKRTQAGNLIAAGVIKPVSNDESSPDVIRGVPQNITVETAIQYFRDNAVGEYERLYKATAQWLERYNTYSRTLVNKAVEESAEITNTVDMSEVTDNE